jgi:hypothetical protein
MKTNKDKCVNYVNDHRQELNRYLIVLIWGNNT